MSTMANQRTDYTASGNALQKQHDDKTGPLKKHQAFLSARMDKLGQWVTQGLKPEALIRFVLADLSTNTRLQACTPESVYLALLSCAVTGLEPGALRNEAYIVPFGTKAQFMPGYRGLIKMARRSREVVGMVANVVMERDLFEVDLGTSNSIVHKPAMRDRGDVIGAYAIASMVGGHSELEWMDIEDLDAVRRVAESRGKSPAWDAWPTEMQRKTVLRRLAKRLPLGTDYHIASLLEHAASAGDEQKVTLDAFTDGAASQSDAQVAAAPKVDVPEDFAFNPEEVPS